MSAPRRHTAVSTRARLISGLAFLMASGSALADWKMGLQTPATPLAQDILELHDIILGICVVIGIIVFGVMIYSMIAHRKSRGHKPATFSHNTTLEVVWTIIPFLILVGMAIPSTATVLKAYNTSKPALTVKITGYQWKWRYDYPEQNIDYFSVLSTPEAEIENKEPKDKHYLLEVDHPLVLPVGEKVRLLVTSTDVIHSWWVPAFGVKRDAIPGFIHDSWVYIDKPGTYRGQCTELCGQGHGFMPVVVKAVSQEDFAQWVSQEKTHMAAAQASNNKVWTRQELMARGQQVYAQCAACHGAQGKGVPGVFPPLEGNPVVTAPGPKEHIDVVLNGLQGKKIDGVAYTAAMPAWAQQLDNADIAAVITFERNSFGNHVGTVVQPSDVAALRK